MWDFASFLFVVFANNHARAFLFPSMGEGALLHQRQVSLAPSVIRTDGRNQRSDSQISMVPNVSSEEASTRDETETEPKSTADLNQRIDGLCRKKHTAEAIRMLERTMASDSTVLPDAESFSRAISALVAQDKEGLDRAERLFVHMKTWGGCATRETTEALMRGWHAHKRGEARAYERCDQLLRDLWKQQNDLEKRNADDTQYVGPTRSTYLYVLEALLLSDDGRRGKQIAEKTQGLLDEMDSLAPKYPQLKPNIVCINVVLLAWTRSGVRDAANRAASLLQQVETRYFAGENDLRPSADAYNIVLDALARSSFRGAEEQAEKLVYHMDRLATENEKTMGNCKPDIVSFNSVLNSWSRSKSPQGPKRAEAILDHMESRFRDGESDVAPDSVSYNTVMSSWARSGKGYATTERVLARMEAEFKNGNLDVEPTVISYNILINAIAQSKDKGAVKKALAVLKQMKTLGNKDNRPKCLPDAVTYNTIIGAVAKSTSLEQGRAQKAMDLLRELESMYETSRDIAFRPSMQTYTTTINAIARSRGNPELALELVERLEEGFRKGVRYMRPDCVCYCSLLNAYGWSDAKGKSKQCYAIFQKMKHLFESQANVWAKPDIIACNAILNACAFDTAETEEEKEEIMNIVIDVLETYQSSSPKFGWPNHVTYAYTLQAITNHISDPAERADMAESTFLQCCSRGHVSVPVVLNLERSMPWPRFSRLMGDALKSQEGERLFFWHSALPPEWTRYAPSHKEHQVSRPGVKTRYSFKPSMARVSRK